MTRTLAICALASLISSALAETPAEQGVVVPQPTIAAEQPPAPVAVSACDKASCPAVPRNTTAKSESPQHALLKQKLAEMNCLQCEIEELRRATGTPQQVHVNVQVLEISRTKLQKLDLDITTIDKEQQPKLTSLLAPERPYAMRTVADSAALRRFLVSLQDNGIARVLADPSIVTTCGQPCTFRVGGDVPLPSAPGSNSPIDFVKYGTDIDVLAIAVGDNRVRLNLRARVSEIDESRSLEVAGERVPALNVRQIDTAIELGFGQTGILSGLVQRRTESVKRDDKVVATEEEVELLFLVTLDASTALAAKTQPTPSAK